VSEDKDRHAVVSRNHPATETGISSELTTNFSQVALASDLSSAVN
jgi:hypothetical protein